MSREFYPKNGGDKVKKKLVLLLLVLFLAVLTSTVLSAFKVVPPTERANPNDYYLDKASLLKSWPTINQISADLEKKTSVRVMTVVLPERYQRGADINEYASAIRQQWPVGKDNGVVILVVDGKEALNVAVSVGSGLEKTLDDAKIATLMGDYLVPSVSAGYSNEGIFRLYLAVVGEIALTNKVTVESYIAPPYSGTKKSDQVAYSTKRYKAVEPGVFTQNRDDASWIGRLAAHWQWLIAGLLLIFFLWDWGYTGGLCTMFLLNIVTLGRFGGSGGGSGGGFGGGSGGGGGAGR